MDKDSIRRRPLRELPALTIQRAEADVRGWTVAGRDGRPVGHVRDLLADVDSLTAEYVIVRIDRDESATETETTLPLAALRPVPGQRQLVSDGGSGMTAIRLRYRSTTGLVWWAVGLLIVIATVLLVFDVWRP